MKSSGTDDPEKYVGKWEKYDEPQGIYDRQDKKVLAKETNSFGPQDMTTRFAPEPEVVNIQVGPDEQDAIKKSRKAPKKHARSSAKALSARGKPPKLNPYRLDETIRRPFTGSLTAEYEIIDEEERPVGFASVADGIIETFDYVPDTEESYRGHIMSAMLSQMVSEADRNKANLSIQINDMDGDIKYMFERFGFRHVGKDIMKRNHGAIRPDSVSAPQGMVNREMSESLQRTSFEWTVWENNKRIGSVRASDAKVAKETAKKKFPGATKVKKVKGSGRGLR